MFYKNGKLNDQEIVDALALAESLYIDGAIIEAKNVLEDIIKAFNKFEKEYEI